MAYNKKKIIWTGLLILVLAGLFFSRSILKPKVLISDSSNNYSQNNSSEKLRKGTLIIGQKKINIDIAENDSQWYKGLSNRANICEDCGMFFLFPGYDNLSFVMRDMKFPLDIIFIRDNEILNIAENLAPATNDTKNIYSSKGEANRVLEVNAGFSKKQGIKAGDKITDIQIN